MADATENTGGIRQRLRIWARGRWALPFSALLGFLENTIVLFAMEPLFLPIMASRGKGAWWVATFLLAGNVVGGVVMYALGHWLAEPVIEPLVHSLGISDQYAQTTDDLKENGFWAVFLVGVTFIPFQAGAAAAGAIGYAFPLFILAITISRAIRYFALAALVRAIGSHAEDFLEKHELEIFLGGLAAFVGVAAYYMHMA